MDSALARNRTAIGAASLVVGPALMSAGDLFHPPENWAPATQVAIVAESASRWYAAHLLLFVGMILFIPGILAMTEAAASRRPVAGYAARLLMIASVGALSAVFAFEMLLGQFVSQRSDQTAAIALLEAFQSGAVFGPLLPGLLAFFIGTGLAVFSFASMADPFRWPAVVLALGATLILGEIVLAEVLLSQIGNILNLVAGIGFARLLLQGRGAAPASPIR